MTFLGIIIGIGIGLGIAHIADHVDVVVGR